ncbi:MAG: class I SAM-dependent methyltransferase [Bdellovibrionales bacterium]|nr:class I SAM-dependent methyltransferase [Bdellovibrionales bacterium]
MDSAANLVGIGRQFLTQGQDAYSLVTFKLALELDPAFLPAHVLISESYRRLGESARAAKHLAKAFQLSSSREVTTVGARVALSQAASSELTQHCHALCNGLLDDAEQVELHHALRAHFESQAIAAGHTAAEESSTTSKPVSLESPLTDLASVVNYCVLRFGFRKYLEIGCNQEITFRQIIAPYRIGVDPVKGGSVRLTSDEFFAETNDDFDIILIDGLHRAEQVLRDVGNALRYLRRDGVIILHDCSPATEAHQAPEPVEFIWNGDVWKALVALRTDPQLDIVTGDFDYGVGVIRRRPNSDPIVLPRPYLQLSWQELEQHRQEWLRLCLSEEVKAWL